MYLRKIRPRTTCLYSAASMLERSLSAASQSFASKPSVAPLVVDFFVRFPCRVFAAKRVTPIEMNCDLAILALAPSCAKGTPSVTEWRLGLTPRWQDAAFRPYRVATALARDSYSNHRIGPDGQG